MRCTISQIYFGTVFSIFRTAPLSIIRSLNSVYTAICICHAETVKVGKITSVYTCRLEWSLYTCLTQLYGGIDMYNLLHKEQLHVSALFIGHLQVDK